VLDSSNKGKWERDKEESFQSFFPIPTQTKETPIRESIKAAAYQYIEIIDLH